MERRDSTQATPLWLAAARGHERTPKVLVDAGAQQAARDAGGKPFVRANCIRANFIRADLYQNPPPQPAAGTGAIAGLSAPQTDRFTQPRATRYPTMSQSPAQ
jgi:hypothetical protein